MKRKDVKLKIMYYFFENPTQKLRTRQIERSVIVALPSVIQYTKKLIEEEIIKKEQIAGVVVFSANRTSKKYLLEKKFNNIRKVIGSGLVEYLVTQLSNPIIILFGSFSRGEDIETSDIDLYVETPSTQKINLRIFEKKLHKDIQLFTHKNIHQIKNKELANNIINGITLNGFIEVIK